MILKFPYRGLRT